jgi:hypothetical protein
MKFTIKVADSRLDIRQSNPLLKLDTQPSKLTMESKNIKVQLDTFEARRSMGLKSVFTAMDESAAKGLEAAAAATAEYAELGSMMAKSYEGANIPNILYNRLFEQPTTYMVFLPSVGPQIAWEPNQLGIDYTPARVTSELMSNPVELKFIRGGISIDIEQFNKLQIDYLGEPNYVPPSADPTLLKQDIKKA